MQGGVVMYFQYGEEETDYLKARDPLLGELIERIGRWTAEMIPLFCLQRPDVLAFDDLAVQRGLRMTYHHRRITRKLFEKYCRRYSPYGSVASLYLWAVAGGAIPDMRDYAPKTDKRGSSSTRKA